mmetsp:Transcript_18145/g.39223  ORF Transcript_18145/g.39223 Transcript_18145/m.39223 type:complete len:92 (-) Transcript_18145:632-907(-)
MEHRAVPEGAVMRDVPTKSSQKVCAIGMVPNINYAPLKGVGIKSNRGVCAASTEQKSKNAVMKGVRIMQRKEDIVRGISITRRTFLGRRSL